MNFYIGTSFKNIEIMNKVAEKLKELGWKHTFNWTEELIEEETLEDLERFSKLEKQAIMDSDVVIILLPAGRGTHVELGIALALDKKVYLYSEKKQDFDTANTVNFYYDKGVNRVIGNPKKLILEVTKNEKR